MDMLARALGRLRQMSLGVQIALLLGTAILPIGILGVWQAVVAAREAETLERQALVGMAERSAAEERALLMSAFGALDALAASGTFPGPDCDASLGRVVENSPFAVLATMIDMSGKMVCRSDGGAEINLSDVPSIASLMENPRPLVWATSKGRASGQSVLVAAVPVRRGGQAVGLMTLSLSRSGLSALVSDAAIGERFRAMLVDDRGVPLVADAEAGWRPKVAISPAQMRGGAPVPGTIEQVGVVVMAGRDGETRTYAVAPIIEGLVYEIASWSTGADVGAAQRRIALSAAFPLLMWAAALVTAYIAMDRLVVQDIRRMRADIRAFTRAARALPDAGYRESAGEIAEVGRAFTAMTRIIAREESAQKRLLAEKTELLMELHHRVRNNLQLIVSMINMQLRDIGGDAQRAALTDLQARVMGIASVHRALFEAEDLGAVDAAALIGEIAASLVEGSGLDVDAELTPLTIAPDAALPIALIAAEAMLGAVRRPGDEGADGEPAALTIRLSRAPGPDGPDIALVVDAPAPAGRQPARKKLGARLMQALATQLTADFTIHDDARRRTVSLVIRNANPVGPADRGAPTPQKPESET